MAVRIRALDGTLVGKHVQSSNPTTPKFVPNTFAAGWRLLSNAPSKGHHSRYIKLFFKGTSDLVSFSELMEMSLAGLKHFLR